MTRTAGIEPASSILETDILPLNYAREIDQVAGLEPQPSTPKIDALTIMQHPRQERI